MSFSVKDYGSLYEKKERSHVYLYMNKVKSEVDSSMSERRDKRVCLFWKKYV